MPTSCGYCGASMPDISEFCPHCGRPVREGNVFAPDPAASAASAGAAPQASAAAGRTTTLPEAHDAPSATQPPVDWNDRAFGALAYLTFIPALVFVFAKSYEKRRFVRFHAVQSLFFWGAALLFGILGVLVSMFGWLFLWLLSGTLIGLALFFTWLLLFIKALQGEWFSLPLLGTLAGQQAGP